MRQSGNSRHAGGSKKASRGAGALLPRCAIAVFVVTSVALLVPSVGAAAQAPHWTVSSQAAPTDFHAGDGDDFYEIVAVNDGSAATSGTLTVADTLPAGLQVVAISGIVEVLGSGDTEFEHLENCTQATHEERATVTCATAESVPVGRQVVLSITVSVPGDAAGTLGNAITVSGGGAPTATAGNETSVTPTSEPVPFGGSLTDDVTDESGGEDTQAGSHPFIFNTLLNFNSASVKTNESCVFSTTPSCADPDAQAKDVEVALPAGMVGNPTAVPTCKQATFEGEGFYNCPAATQVGDAYLYFYGASSSLSQYSPVYNIEPPPGQPAELGFSVSTLAHIPIFFHVRSESDYGLTAYVEDANQFDAVRAVELAIWGAPTEAAHDALRLSEEPGCGEGCPSGVPSPKPFLTMPTSCSSDSLSFSLASDSWQDPEVTPKLRATSEVAGMTGCGALAFNPAITAEPTSRVAGAPTGYDVHVDVPQNESIEGLATPDVHSVEVSLPQGTVLSPSGANGLVSCSDAQFGLKERAKGSCPGASKVGTVKITTPVLSEPVTGNLYVGEPECSPCSPAQAEAGQMVSLFLEAEGAGVIVKQAGHTQIDQATGQLTAVFDEVPQLPFSDVEVALEPGANAPLENPSACGQVAATGAVTPWSALTTAVDVTAPGVPIEGCSAAGFAPSFRAGATGSGRGGAFAGFAVSLSRGEGEQTLGKVSVNTPPGLLGVLKNVAQCSEAQANAGTCSAASQIGTGSITAGPGSAPLSITGGRVYLTGPYAGEPFGLSIVTPAQAGPFVLAGNAGNGTEVVRASIAVNPSTAALTISSGALPQALDGVPLDIRTVNIDADRGEFTFNPTNCSTQSVTGTITSAQNTSASVAMPFQASDCASLPFKPVFTASTTGEASKAEGASLTVKVAGKGGPQTGGGEANIKSVKVDLPKQLPSRLTTLQKACTEAQFNANPAGCPKESNVGSATANTPVLANPLIGPAYLVSHGNEAFPDLEIVLQGEGIKLVLDGNTLIKNGITSSTFKTVPDAPISSFELKLPTGKFSILGTDLPQSAHYSLCGQTLAMPTAITGQNGTVIKQTTTITVGGCAKAKTLTRAQKLALALKACNKKAKTKRATCKAKARKEYGPIKKKAKKG